MSIEIKQQLQLKQQLVMTPQLQLAIRLLQMSQMELVELVRQEMVENPVIEENQEEYGDLPDIAERPDDAPQQDADSPSTAEAAEAAEAKEAEHEDREASFDIDWESYIQEYDTGAPLPSTRYNSEDLPSLENTLTPSESLFDHLLWQVMMSNFTPSEEGVAMLILGNIDEDGYFRDPPLDLIADQAGVELAVAEEVLTRIQEFDPVGVASRDLKDCLFIQAKHLGVGTEAMRRIIYDHLHNMEFKNYQAISRDLQIPVEDVVQHVRIIANMEPRPGRIFGAEAPQYITPDIYVYKVGDEYITVLNEDGLPKLKISNLYRSALSNTNSAHGAKEYIQDKLRSAIWLIRSIHQRQRTIVRVTESIIKFQQEFLDKGIGYLRPLILKDVADDIQMHESTVSRVTTNKYVHTPQGIFELKYFFNSSISRLSGEDIASESVKEKIRQIVAKEDRSRPFSDQRIAQLLKEQNIDIARRTVAKYREQMGILPSSKRKQLI